MSKFRLDPLVVLIQQSRAATSLNAQTTRVMLNTPTLSADGAGARPLMEVLRELERGYRRMHPA